MKNGKTIGILASAALLVLVYFASAHADEDSWSTGGPYGASIMDIALHPSDTLRMYIGTVSSGIFQTTNGGEEWSRIEDDTLERTLRAIRIHPFGPDTMYASTVHGIFKSTDIGQSWVRLPLQNPTNEYRDLEIHPDNPSILFSGKTDGPVKSTNAGETWYHNWGGIPSNVNVEDIEVDPINTNIVYFTGGRDYKSTDYGENWYDISPDVFGTTIPISLAIDPVNSEVVYLGRWDNILIGTCLYKSTNGGDDWIDITPPGLIGSMVRDVDVSPFDHNTVFITTLEDGIFRSDDGGEHWEEINEGLAVRDAWRMVIDPDTGNLYLGLLFDGIYRSRNNGDSWEKISYNVTGAYCTDIAANWRDPDTLYTATQAGLYISTDGAESWERIILDVPYHEFICDQVAVDPHNPSYVYLPLYAFNLQTEDGEFYRSADGGSTWESFSDGLPDVDYYSIAVADYYGSGWRRLFLGTSAGLYYSDDLGENWWHCQGGLPDNIAIYALAVSPVNPEIVFAGELYYFSNAVYKSSDGGGSWMELDMPRGRRASEIVCDPVDQDIVYVSLAGQAGIFKSTDGGQSWDNIDNNLPRAEYPYNFGVSGIAINPLNSDNVFVYSVWMGVFQSHDGGQSWEDFYNESLRIGPIGHTLIDPVDTSRVFLAQYGNSVWEITRTPTAIDNDRYILPLAFSASSYPNPFNPATTIEYSIPEETFVNVEIFDLLGRKVETLVSRDHRAGTYRVVWNAKERASGLYFYKVDAGQHSQTGVMTLLK